MLLLGAAGVWWALAMRPWAPETIGGFALTVVATFSMLVLSVVAEARTAAGLAVSRAGQRATVRRQRDADTVISAPGA